MRAVDVIAEKRQGRRHSRATLEQFLGGFLRGEVADYQVAAWLMAVCFQGMEAAETADLTAVMAASGDLLDLGGLPYTVDKHSTGGVGDKTSLVLAPLLAEAGATVAKMSGRALGHTGGTIDKLESIPGLRTTLSDEEFLAQARAVGVVIAGQSKELAPADGLLYALRDATATVASLPLIASSIMSKKLAGGAQALVLDVKVGSGAFMRTADEARELAALMIAIGRANGRRVGAVLSGMGQPLGEAVGNAVEVEEAARCLRGEGPADLEELCLALAEQLLAAAGLPQGQAELRRLLRSGAAYRRFERWIAAQGGDPAVLERLELAEGRTEVAAVSDGVVARVDALAVGEAVGLLGGGRSRKGEQVDHGVGALVHVKVGERVARGQPLVTLLHRGGRGLEEAAARVRGGVAVAAEPREPARSEPLVLEVLSA